MSHMVFAQSPARDRRFRVARNWAQCENLPEGDPRKTVEFLHRQMNEEIDALECSARSLFDFPDASWETRLFLARQCADEARHAVMFRRMFLARGGTIGEFPVLNFQYEIICGFDSLLVRLAVQNRTFEAEGIDAIDYGIGAADDGGDAELSELLDAQLADEIGHVRMANEVIQQQLAATPRLVMQIAAALHRTRSLFADIFGSEGTKVVKYGVSEVGRLEAGFAPGEIDVARQLAVERGSA